MKQKNVLLIFLVLLGAVISTSGCLDPTIIFRGPGHARYYKVKGVDNKTGYTCTYGNPEPGRATSYISVLEKKENDEKVTLELVGRADSLAITPNGDIAAIALDQHVLAYTFALVDTNSMKLMNSWELMFPGCEGFQDQIYPAHLDHMDLTHDGTQLAAAYYLSRRCGEKKVSQGYSVSIWDTTKGKFLFELFPPQPSEDYPAYGGLEGIYDLKFSPDDKYIAVYGGYSNYIQLSEKAASSKLNQFFGLLFWPYNLKHRATVLVWHIDTRELVLLKDDLPVPILYCLHKKRYNRNFKVEKNNPISWINSPTGLQIQLLNGQKFNINK